MIESTQPAGSNDSPTEAPAIERQVTPEGAVLIVAARRIAMAIRRGAPCKLKPHELPLVFHAIRRAIR